MITKNILKFVQNKFPTTMDYFSENEIDFNLIFEKVNFNLINRLKTLLIIKVFINFLFVYTSKKI